MSPLRVLLEDERVVAVSKPSGRLVIPGRGPAGEPALRDELRTRNGGKVFVVHRLDRGASGVLLFAKDAEAHRALSIQFEKGLAKKAYLVAVAGEVPRDGRVNSPLKEFGSGRVGVHPDGKPSETRWQARERLRGATLLEVRPATGRRHQIRVHLYSLGHPVLGDETYGKDRPVGGAPRLMLHAWRLRFKHPDGRLVGLEDEPPADFQSVIEGLRRKG